MSANFGNREPFFSDTQIAIFTSIFYFMGIIAEHIGAYFMVLPCFYGIILMVWLPVIDRIEWSKLDKRRAAQSKTPEGR
jgi:hypothetical protein